MVRQGHEKGLRVEGKVARGTPARVIVDVPKEHDLIVMGTHGKGLLENTFVGSMAQRVMRRSRRPIFVVPLPTDPGDITVEEAPA